MVEPFVLLRERHDYTSVILKNIDNRIVSAEIVRDGYGDDGYVEFEAWGTKENNNPRYLPPEELLSPLKNNQELIKDNQELKDLFAYLEKRYREEY